MIDFHLIMFVIQNVINIGSKPVYVLVHGTGYNTLYNTWYRHTSVRLKHIKINIFYTLHD